MTDERQRDTNPDNLRPSQPLMDMRESFALGQALHGLDSLAKYLDGKLDGRIAEVANQIGTDAINRQALFESHVRIELKEIKSDVKSIKGDVAAIRGMLRPLGIHLGELQAEHARNHGPVELRLSEPPASEQEAQEG